MSPTYPENGLVAQPAPVLSEKLLINPERTAVIEKQLKAKGNGAPTFDDVQQVAADYYDSNDADGFYMHLWGGVDIHLGIYDPTKPLETQDIADASRRTVHRIKDMLAATGVLKAGSRGMDLGAGYGGSARTVAEQYGCSVDCLNISEVQNRRNEQLTAEAGLSDKVHVIYGSFQDIPAPSESYDWLWSQDAIDHASDKAAVFREAARVLRPGGYFVFTDLMKADHVPASELSDVLARIKLPDMGSLALYTQCGEAAGLKVVKFDPLHDHLTMHYDRVRMELVKRGEELAAAKVCSPDFQETMKTGLGHWVNAGRAGKLNWGIVLVHKPMTQ